MRKRFEVHTQTFWWRNRLINKMGSEEMLDLLELQKADVHLEKLSPCFFGCPLCFAEGNWHGVAEIKEYRFHARAMTRRGLVKSLFEQVLENGQAEK